MTGLLERNLEEAPDEGRGVLLLVRPHHRGRLPQGLSMELRDSVEQRPVGSAAPWIATGGSSSMVGCTPPCWEMHRALSSRTSGPSNCRVRNSGARGHRTGRARFDHVASGTTIHSWVEDWWRRTSWVDVVDGRAAAMRFRPGSASGFRSVPNLVLLLLMLACDDGVVADTSE